MTAWWRARLHGGAVEVMEAWWSVMREVTKVKKIGKGNMSREYIFTFRVLVLLKHPNVG